MDTVQETKKDGVRSGVWNSSSLMSALSSWSASVKSVCGSGKDKVLQAIHPSILSKYSWLLLALLMVTALLLWLMKRVVKDPDSKEATVLYSSTTALAESESGSEEACRHGSKVRIPVRDNNAFRIRQMYAAMKLGKTLPTPQNGTSTKQK